MTWASVHTLWVVDQRVDILNQALPYIQHFRGQTFVIKYGGSAMKRPGVLTGVIRNLLLLKLVGINPVLVHGGGPEIDAWLTRLGIEKRVHEGLRITDEETMDVVEMALGRANKALVSEIQRAGGKAIGLSGRDGDLMIGEPISDLLGRVGKILQINPQILTVLSESGYIPVVSSVASDSSRDALNVNADTAASAIAGAVSATKLILMTDTDGVLAERSDPTSTIAKLTLEEARAMVAAGRADGGMIPKLEAGISAVKDGVTSVHLINGASPNALLLEIFTDNGVGTMITG